MWLYIYASDKIYKNWSQTTLERVIYSIRKANYPSKEFKRDERPSFCKCKVYNAVDCEVSYMKLWLTLLVIGQNVPFYYFVYDKDDIISKLIIW